jgi:hypothetical protein
MRCFFRGYAVILYDHGAYYGTTMPAYYDLILGLIPLALLGITGSLHFGGGLVLPVAVSAAGVVTMGLIGHALFVRAPVDAPTAGPVRAE